MLAISKMISGVSKKQSTKDDSNQELVILRVTVYLLALISTATWWYALPKIEGPISEVFMPQYFIESPQEPDECLRSILQYDYICTYSAGFLWLAYHFSDLEKAGICEVPWIRALVVAGVVGVVVGPGSLFILIWLFEGGTLGVASFSERAREVLSIFMNSCSGPAEGSQVGVTG
ncbi:hypothetical protein CEP52_006615 [Fusarium oligoseptatum]|uniref:Uncharacterized protein n=1 Tax=Fusarium oligoseptatum TaxID=2604345 RepID=A0A428TS21_9HYPO|nr:hypothetical protein CEP52_006615 [Fusarium oligoseptatum]